MKMRIVTLLWVFIFLLTGCITENSESWIQYLLSEKKSDTSNDKSQNISQCFQIYKKKIYLNEGEWMKRIDIDTEERINLVKKKSDKFFVKNDKIFFMDYKNEPCISTYDLTNTSDNSTKEYWGNITSMIVVKGEIIGLRISEKTSYICKKNGKNEEIVCQFPTQIGNSFADELVGYYNGNYYLADFNEQKIYEINKNTKVLKEIFGCKQNEPYAYQFLKIRYIEGKLFILGVVIDTENSSLGGSFYVKSAADTGVWEISLDGYKSRKLSSILYNDLYVFDKNIYGVYSKGYEILNG